MEEMERFEKIVKIVKRSEMMGIGFGDRVDRLMDIDWADKQFTLRLDEFLNADDMNFIHDFCGIQNHMDREKGECVDFFVPRFAGRKDD